MKPVFLLSIATLAMLLATGSRLTGQESGGKPAEQTDDEPTNSLQKLLSDDFSVDSRKDYQIKGEVDWEKGKLNLSEGAAVARSFEAGAWLKVAADVEFPQVTEDGEQSLTMLQIKLEGATPCYAAWQQTRKDGKTSGRVLVLDTVPKDGKATLKVVQSLTVAGPLESGKWSVEYRHGLLQVRREQRTVLSGFVENGAAMAGGMRWGATRSSGILNRLAVRGTHRSAPLSKKQQQKSGEAAKQNMQLIQLYRQGKFAGAARLGESICDILKQTLGARNPDYATSLNNLAGLYQALGQYAKAEPRYVEVREIRKRVLGVEHPDYAASLNDLGILYRLQGAYVKAEPLFLAAREIRKRVLGVDHPDYAASVNSLGILYKSQGAYAKAEPLYVEARDIRKRVLGVDHPDYAASLNNLAVLYKLQGAYEKAEPLYLKALEIRKRVLGVDHANYAESLNNLAAMYSSQGAHAKAEPLYVEALEIRKRVLGVDHPDYAASLNNLATLYWSQGEFAKAEPLHLEARDVRRRVLGVDHSDYAASVHNLAALYWSHGDFVQAERLYQEALVLSRQLIERNAAAQSQATQIIFGTKLRVRLDSLLSFRLESSSASSELSDELLSWKGMTLMRQRRYRLAGEDEVTRPILEKLTAAARRQSFLLRQTPTPQKRKAWREQVTELSEKRDALESELAAASEEFRKARDPLTTDELLQMLPDDAVLVDFLSFKFWQRVPKDDYHVMRARRHFLGTVLRKGKPVQFVNLGPEADINKAVAAWRTVFLSKNPDDEEKVELAGRALRKLVWEPLLAHLKNAKTVILSPDRSLGQVAFAALPGKKSGTFLIEDHRIASIPVPQLLPALLQESPNSAKSDALLLVGDVNYDEGIAAAGSRKSGSGVRSSAELFQNVAFEPLAETGEEVNGIRDLFLKLHQTDEESVRVLKKDQATESAFQKNAGGYSMLHLATHGFFADPSKKSVRQYAEEEEETSGTRSGLFANSNQSLNYVRGFHPGMLSGLALAGANHAPESEDEADGILTADEISFLRLEGVDLVVLSACETGLGPVAGGEGLLGVQRAFQVSGARSVVASLWNVDDLATRRLMDRFYRNLWEKKDQKLSRLDALREAQMWMLNNPDEIGGADRGALVRLKPRSRPTQKDPAPKGRTHPRYWAAFVLSGDWR